MPGLNVEVTGASYEKYSVVPVLRFDIAIRDLSGQRVHALILRSQIRVLPASRRYTEAEKLGLRELFGEPYRWEETVKSFFWNDGSVALGMFEGFTSTTLAVPLSTDLEVASSKYFSALEGGEAPIEFLFSGTVFRVSSDSRLVVEPISWSMEASYNLPVSVLREALDAHFPGMSWLKVSRETLEALTAFKVREALPTWDSAVSALIAQKAVSVK